jgi:hypothetical protein
VSPTVIQMSRIILQLENNRTDIWANSAALFDDYDYVVPPNCSASSETSDLDLAHINISQCALHPCLGGAPGTVVTCSRVRTDCSACSSNYVLAGNLAR